MQNYIRINPSREAKLPQINKFVGKAYSKDQANELLLSLENEELRPAVVLGLFYGLRRSEVCGLRWCDIDFEAGTLTVCNTVTRLKTTVEAEQTKSTASKRVMMLIPGTIPYLKELYQSHLSHPKRDKDGHVCVHSDGRPFDPSYVSRGFKRLLKRHGLPEIRFHELRHTAGSLLLANGMNPKQIQAYIGHENVQTTLDIYTHLSVEGKAESANAMDQILTFVEVLDKGFFGSSKELKKCEKRPNFRRN